MILNDTQIAELAMAGMITPYSPTLISEERGRRIVSYGQSSFGYDMRVASEWESYDPDCGVIDPKKAQYYPTTHARSSVHVIPPNGFVLCRSVERFVIPDDVMVVVLGKSTYARCGIVVNVTPLEPGWEGYVTIELSNTTASPVMVYANEGIAQCLFYRGERPNISYADRNGKYQKQPERIVKGRV